MKTQNNLSEIEASYLAFAKRILADVTVWRGTQEVARHTQTELRFHEDGFDEDTHEYVSYWPIVMNHYGDPVWGTQDAEQAARLHLLNGVIQPPTLSDARGSRSPVRC